MPTEAIRCSDCGAVFKGVPAWLRGAKVKFTCTNCPKRTSRAAPRFEGAITPPVAFMDPEKDLERVLISDDDDDSEDDPEMDIHLSDDLDDVKDDKDL